MALYLRRKDITMNIPYRTQRALKRGAVTALIVILVLALIGLCWFVWLKRYVIYTRDKGAVLDMQMSAQIPEGEAAVPPPEQETVSIYYNEGENAINTSKELTKITGYYADTAALEKSVEEVLQQASALPTGTPVMLDVKSGKGNFYYSSAVSENRHKRIDPTAVDRLIQELDKKGMYLIAKLPALRDYHYGLIHDEDGLFVASGRFLWADEGYCYWLNPTRQGTIAWLVQIVTELKSLGFDEVVFDDFRFPDTDNLKFKDDKEEALATAARTLVTTCATDSFAVSFIGQNASFALPEGRSRLYLENVAAAEAAGIAGQLQLDNLEGRLVFLTEVHDTRFNDYSVLRPLEAAH